MTTRNAEPGSQISQTDLTVNQNLRTLVERQGTTLTELGRRLQIPQSSWYRKISDNPKLHQRYGLDEVVRIAAALGVTVNDLAYSAGPVVSSEG